MKNNGFWAFMAHTLIVVAMMFLVFFCIDRVNPGMEFISSEISKWLLLAFALLALVNGIHTVVMLRSIKKKALDSEAREDWEKPEL